MPFTATHALAAIPVNWIWSRHGTFSALVIGTMIPDWPIYVPISPSYETTHSLAGIFTACLPIGFLVTLTFHLGLKRALFELLPDTLKSRLVRYVDAPSVLQIATLCSMAAAVVIGAATHIVWDSFTHRGTWGVELFPVLKDTLMSVGGMDLPGYMVLQLGCSLISLPVFLLLFRTWYGKAEVRAFSGPGLSPLARRTWQLVFLGMPLAVMTVSAADAFDAASGRAAAYALVRGITRTGFLLLVLFVCFGLYYALNDRLGRLAKVRQS